MVAGPDPELRVAPGVSVPFRELQWRFSASGGAGGQHVNTSNTRASVTFDIAGSPSLPAWARSLMVERLGPVITVTASDRRSQARNRDLALARLRTRLASALTVAASRTPTHPTTASQRRRLEEKRRRGRLKRERGARPAADE